MRVKGALHVHSDLSHDGTMTIPDLARWFRRKGYDFVAMGEHSQDIDEQKAEVLKTQCAEYSGRDFCMIPGIEFSCRGGFHIFGLGITGTTQELDPLAVVNHIHALNGLAILAHPQKYGWGCPRELLHEVDAAEIWNCRYDGKYLPSYRAPRAFEKMQTVNPRLRAIAGQDFHGKDGFYDLAIEMEIQSLRGDEIIEGIRRGEYRMKSRFFSATANPRFSWPYALSLNLLSRKLAFLRKVRDLMVRWTT